MLYQKGESVQKVGMTVRRLGRRGGYAQQSGAYCDVGGDYPAMRRKYDEEPFCRKGLEIGVNCENEKNENCLFTKVLSLPTYL